MMKKIINKLKSKFSFKFSKKESPATQESPPSFNSLPAQDKFAFLKQIPQKLKDIFPGSKTHSKKKKSGKKSKKRNRPSSGSNFEIREFASKVFSPDLRGKIHTGFIALFLVTLVYSTGRLAAVLLKGKPHLKQFSARSISNPKIARSKDFDTIKIADLFGSKKAGKASKVVKKKTIIDKTKVCISAKTSSNLPITLLNTVVMQDQIKSLASIQVRGNKKIQSIREGEIIDGMAQIGRIDRLELVFKNLRSGRCEYIANKKSKTKKRSPINVLSPAQSRKLISGKKVKGVDNKESKFKISKSFLNNKLKDIGSILTQARAIQIKNPDGSLSFNMQEVEPGSIYSVLGIGNNDTITGINGKKIQSINQVMDLFGKIRELDHLTLKINRNGMESVQEYNISD